MKKAPLLIVLGLIIIGSTILLFFPNAKDNRIVARAQELKAKVLSMGGKEMTADDIKQLKSIKSFHYRKNEGAPQLYVCIPGYGNNIAILAWEKYQPRLDKFDMFVVPRESKESPSSEKALGMCLIQTPEWDVQKLRVAAGNMVGAKPAIEAAWSKVSEKDQKTIRDTLQANYEHQKDMGEWVFALLIGKHGYYIPGWNQMRPKDHEILDEIILSAQ